MEETDSKKSPPTSRLLSSCSPSISCIWRQSFSSLLLPLYKFLSLNTMLHGMANLGHLFQAVFPPSFLPSHAGDRVKVIRKENLDSVQALFRQWPKHCCVINMFGCKSRTKHHAGCSEEN